MLKQAANHATVTITSADIWHSLRKLNENNITVFRVQMKDELSASIEIRRRDLSLVSRLLKKRGDTVCTDALASSDFLVGFVKSRIVLVVSVLSLIILSLYLPSRVLFIQVQGNHRIPSKRILEAAEQCGIHFFTARRSIRSESVKNQLLSLIPELQWAGVNSLGCKANISVEEKSPDSASESGKFYVSHIIAGRDGIIRSANAAEGTLLCSEGQAVREGELLISGYTDCGFCIRASKAAGDIFAETNHSLTAVSSNQQLRKTSSKGTRHEISFILGKKRIKIWKDSGILDTSCDRIYKTYSVSLPGGNHLPLSVCIELYTPTAVTVDSVPDNDAGFLEDAARDYLKSQMIAGIIEQESCTVSRLSDVFQFRGTYRAVEMIGRELVQKIGDIYVQDSRTNRER